MRAAEIIERVRAHHADLMVEGGRLLVQEWGEPVPEDLRAELRECRDDVMQVAWRVVAMRLQVPETGAIPTLVARPESLPARGSCTSCGTR